MSKTFLLTFVGMLLAVAALLVAGFRSLPPRVLTVTVLDVGQGDAILIRTPRHQKILVDAGPPGAVLAPLSHELNFFERRINLAVITHPDADHIAGFSEILQRYEVENILLTGIQSETEWYRDLLAQIAQRGINVIVADAQTDFDFGGGVIIDTLMPSESLLGRLVADKNATSIVNRLLFGETSVLLTGDFDIAGEQELLRTPQNLTSQILKLGHHGSKTSSSAEFIAAVAPTIAVVSAGAGNSYGHPSEEVLARVSDLTIYSTIDSGNIRFTSDGVSWSPQI